MKRINTLFTIALLSLLVSCQVTVSVTTVNITEPTGPVTVNSGGTVVFKAEASSGANSSIAWSDAGAGGSFNPTTGPEVTYTAPLAAGTYSVSAVLGAVRDTETVTVLDPLPADETVSISGEGSADTAITSTTLASGASRVFQIDVPNATAQALIIELDKALELSVFDATKTLYASSVSQDSFARGAAALSTTALETSAISTNVFCRGSCVYQDAAGKTRVFAKVENKGTSTVNVSLFAYAENYRDLGEPNNNSISTATGLSTADAGALESLGDVDFYVVTGSGGLFSFVAANNEVSPQAQIFNGEVLFATITSGQTQEVSPGNVIKIFSSTDLAAASDVSRYSLQIE